MKENKLSKYKIGDKIYTLSGRLSNHTNNAPRIETIVRLTKTTIKTDKGTTYSISRLREYGYSSDIWSGGRKIVDEKMFNESVLEYKKNVLMSARFRLEEITKQHPVLKNYKIKDVINMIDSDLEKF